MNGNLADNILHRLTSNIQSEDRKRRKEALKELYKLLFETNCENSCVSLDIASTKIQKNLFQCLYDSSEAVRDSCIDILSEIVKRICLNEKFLSELISILLSRLGENEVNEPSEEIRLRLVILVDEIVKNAKENISPFTGNIVEILAKTSIDSYPKVRQTSFECAGALSSTVPRNFHDHSNKLIKPILSSFNHQHFRIRVAAIEALGKVVRYGNTKKLPAQEVFGSLAERLFDSNPTVRSSVAKVIGDWLINLYDRYSFFSKMIPLILTCLCDELPELREEAWGFWTKAGVQYEQENEQDLKDKMDFLYEKPDHYPKNVLRPNLGCRTLVQRNTCQIIPALSKELEDWKNDIRIKSAQLLCCLVLHAETDITQHAENLLTIMYKACNQPDSRIVENVEKAAEYIGYFVSPDTYIKLVLQVVEDVCNPGHLCVLAALIRGTRSDLLEPHLLSIMQLLSTDNICRNRDAVYQFQLLQCCESLMNSGSKKCSEYVNSFFIVIVTVKALSSKQQISNFAESLLIKLGEVSGWGDPEIIYKECSSSFLEKMHATVETWTSVSFDQQILLLMLEEGGSAIGFHLVEIMAILRTALRADGDPVVKSKLFTSLSFILLRKHLTMTSTNQETYQNFIKFLIQECICSNLVWHPGRAAEALRTVVLASLCAALLPQNEIEHLFDEKASGEEYLKFELCSKETIEDVFGRLFPLLVNTAEDSAVKSRIFSLKLLQNLLRIVREKDILTPDHVNQTYPVLLKRLDDVSDDVRREAVSTITILYEKLPKTYSPQGFQPHLESLFGTMLIHLDDPDPKFQEMMIGALKVIGRVTPKVIHDKLSVMKDRFRNYKMCNDILEYLKECWEVN